MSKHGTFHWQELNTRDPMRAEAFYARLLGWEFSEMEMPGGPYVMARRGGEPIAGIFAMGEGFEGVPEGWMPYLAVEDVGAAVEIVRREGGECLRDPWDVPGVGRIAIIGDPGGAVLGVMTPAPAPGDPGPDGA